MRLEAKVGLGLYSPASPRRTSTTTTRSSPRKSSHCDSVSSTERKRSDSSIRKKSKRPRDPANPARKSDAKITITAIDYEPIFRRVHGVSDLPICIFPPEPDVLFGMNRSQRVRLLDELSQQIERAPRGEQLSRIFRRKEDLATLMIKALALEPESETLNKLVGELIGLAPPGVIQNLLKEHQRTKFLRQSLLVSLVHAAARNVNQTRRNVSQYSTYKGKEVQHRKRATTEAIVDIVAELFQSYKLPADDRRTGSAVGLAADIHVESLGSLVQARDAKDRGFQIAIVLQAIKKLQSLLNEKAAKVPRRVLYGLRVAVGLLGLAPVAGSVAAGLMPLLENMTSVLVKRKQVKVGEAVKKIRHMCLDIEAAARKEVRETMGDEIEFCDGFDYVMRTFDR